MTSTEPPRYVFRGQLDGVRGVVVAVDVLRAFTTAAYAFDAGAGEIWLAAEVDEALALATSLPGAVVMGEEHGRRPPGFHLSNSPVEVTSADVRGRVLIQRTSAGTRGVLAATDADAVFAASLVCASATAAAVRRISSVAPTYLITGGTPGTDYTGDDDRLTAELIERARTGRPLDAERTAHAVASSREAAITLAIGAGHVHPDDVAFATDVDRFSFAMRAERSDRGVRLVRVDVTPDPRAAGRRM